MSAAPPPPPAPAPADAASVGPRLRELCRRVRLPYVEGLVVFYPVAARRGPARWTLGVVVDPAPTPATFGSVGRAGSKTTRVSLWTVDFVEPSGGGGFDPTVTQRPSEGVYQVPGISSPLCMEEALDTVLDHVPAP